MEQTTKLSEKELHGIVRDNIIKEMLRQRIDVEYCIRRLLDIDTAALAKDEHSRDVLDDAIRNVAQCLCEYTETNNDLNNIEKKMDTNKIEQKTTGPIFYMIKGDKFDVEISRQEGNLNGFEFIPHSISLSEYRSDIKGITRNLLTLDTEIIRRITYFGKPTKITNVHTNQDIIDFITEFNDINPTFIKVYEYDTNGETVMLTTFYYPHIVSANLLQLSNTDSDEKNYKSIPLKISFDSMTNEHIV